MSEVAVKFGVGDSQRRAATWKCWATRGRSKNDVYLACRELRGALKISLHESGQWHVAFDGSFLDRHGVRSEWPTRFMTTRERPAELAPGFTLACKIITPFATVTATTPPNASADIVWIPPPTEGRAVETAVIITGGVTPTEGWPGRRSMGTERVGHFQLDNADMVWVVSRVVSPPRFDARLNHARFFHGKTQADAKGPGLRGIAFAEDADGSHVMYELVSAEDARPEPDHQEPGKE